MRTLPERLSYRFKRAALGPPLTSASLGSERLSKRTALGVLSSDCVSSSAYGSEQILIALVPAVGIAAFTLILPITGVVLIVLLLLTLAYRDVVMTYTRAGGSYVVARDNFGPNVAQVAAVALLIDYVVTVAVQAAAGTDALLSLIHLTFDSHNAFGLDDYSLELTIGVVLLMCWLNLRGIKEAGRWFALPFYLFTGAITLVIVVGLFRAMVEGGLPHAQEQPGMFPLGESGDGWLYGASLFIVLRAFANGGSSLTGLEAISNGVSTFKEPVGRNARATMTVMACTLAFLVGGVSLLAFLTHATPYTDGSPTVLAQEARIVFGDGAIGTAFFVAVQLATALILYTGGNTSFTGFPYLASFVAEDRFLPGKLTRRGHRLAFSNGIIALTAIGIALLLVTGGSVQHLVALYAIGVFTGFFMASIGMFKHHWVRHERGRFGKLVVTACAGVLSALVVLVFAVTKFTEGAWLVVIAFPIGVWALIHINRRYRAEAEALEHLEAPPPEAAAGRPPLAVILVDSVDLAALKALRYSRDLRPRDLIAVHFDIDDLRSRHLRAKWNNLAPDAPLQLKPCPDRNVARAAAQLASQLGPDVTVLIPQRIYSPLIGWFMHGHTAAKISRYLGRLPGVTPLIVPFDVVDKTKRVLEDAGK